MICGNKAPERRCIILRPTWQVDAFLINQEAIGTRDCSHDFASSLAAYKAAAGKLVECMLLFEVVEDVLLAHIIQQNNIVCINLFKPDIKDIQTRQVLYQDLQ